MEPEYVLALFLWKERRKTMTTENPILKTEKLAELNRAMLGLGAPIERDGQGYNKPDFARMEGIGRLRDEMSFEEAYHVVQTLQHWVATLMNWLASLNLMGWQPFAGLRTSDPGSPGDYGSYIRGKWNDIDAAFDQTQSGTPTSTATAVSSAGYQGATHVTINIYQEAPVVGDGGMRAFARMIRDEFDQLSYYGVIS